ncbi:dual specificity protein kinase kns1 [Apophysomyces sp. BC1034]|nr:dual specificity protein kinase kns1 [Apophysomyces sp. BC1015]KAG0175773.1 dual specificity protein kinase kns1 [Apophysomyces sp. BC1021]KAG0186174.1 dual specificity protein kinase kns1 [Apophysomyces sp. BC1034]
MSTSTSRHPQKNWEAEFYKNGYPQEVIVIDDTPTPPPPQQEPAVQYYLPPSASTRSKRLRKDQPEAETSLRIPTITKKRKKESSTIIFQGALHSINTLCPAPAPTSVIQTSFDDKDGHYIIKPNESLTPRYKMMRLLGQGTFGKVVECYDRVKRTFCAIKIIRAIPKYRDASKIEIRVLNTLKENDPLNLNKCIHLLEWFDYRNHICMVFELLGQSVFDFLKFNEFRPFPPHHIQQFAKQLLTSVAFVHDLKLIHTDLKPENILLVNHGSHEVTTKYGSHTKTRLLQNTDIRLIDFGSATFEQDYHSSVVSTRHYRAPEIILGVGWSYPCDIWSIGCILVEFLTGDALFQTHDNLEHLAMMEVVLGKLPLRIIRTSSRDAQKYFKDGRLKYPAHDTTKQSRKYVRALKPLEEIISPSTTLTRHFLDLVGRMLLYDPNSRITAREALRHPFFHINFDEYGRVIEES